MPTCPWLAQQLPLGNTSHPHPVCCTKARRLETAPTPVRARKEQRLSDAAPFYLPNNYTSLGLYGQDRGGKSLSRQPLTRPQPGEHTHFSVLCLAPSCLQGWRQVAPVLLPHCTGNGVWWHPPENGPIAMCVPSCCLHSPPMPRQ